MKEIFIIEQIWMDSWENHIDSSIGYKSVGWVGTEEEAKDIVEKGKVYKSGDHWAIRDPWPEYRYKKLKKL